MASVTFENVGKRFDRTEVLHDVSLEVADREFLVLVGPSGCGKSTLLRLLAGLEESSSGRIKIGSRVVDGLAPRDREIAMVFQDYALYPHMTVEENMSFGLRLRRNAPSEIAERVRRAADILQIGPLLARMPRQLSGGQRQRVAIGRAIVRQPQVFLFDEPLSNLDAKLREEMRVEIAKLHQRLNTTVIYVTHDQVEAMTLASRIAVINGGRIQQLGRPSEIFNQPANLFVAGFIGSPTMNFVEGKIEQADGGLKFSASKGELKTALRSRGSAKPGPAVLGVRPEAVRVETDSKPGAVAAKLEVVELLGHRKNLHLAVGEQKLLAAVDAEFEGAPGDSVRVRLEPTALHLFDPASGSRIG